MLDVHTTHCCLIHGCKYHDNDCTVTQRAGRQEDKCEWCYEDDEEIDRAMDTLVARTQLKGEGWWNFV